MKEFGLREGRTSLVPPLDRSAADLVNSILLHVTTFQSGCCGCRFGRDT